MRLTENESNFYDEGNDHDNWANGSFNDPLNAQNKENKNPLQLF